MASLKSLQFSTTTTTITLLMIVLLLHHIFSLVSCSIQPQHPAISPRELLFEEKNRLGSIPPSCHNKCNDCHPCMAVQVPTLPSHDSVLPQYVSKSTQMERFLKPSSSQGNNNRYSNYKPLGWKCHCGDHFFNP